ncbi:hypothetical protein ACP7H9_04755 [Idiomarina sp. ST20R2A10]|uniref:hypothetical protein n=1 Tax=Idiomarina sp. ST20R2A10 TaxID=3418369 RepID=UPI003EC64177
MPIHVNTKETLNGDFMEFRAPSAAAELNARGLEYLTKNLSDPKAGSQLFVSLREQLGNCVESYPDWHPILSHPEQSRTIHVSSITQVKQYEGIDHNTLFVRGFVTCPYSKDMSDKLVERVNAITGLSAWHLDGPLYSDHAYPVVVEALDVELEADGTIRSRDALAWCAEQLVKGARDAQVAETWWNMRRHILGSPHGSRSSLIVNQFTGGHMRKFLEAFNDSGMYGPIKEWLLDMLSEKKRKKISETLIEAALNQRDKLGNSFEFELRGESCKAEIRDTFGDGEELSIRVTIGESDLVTSGFFYQKSNTLQVSDPNGKRVLAEKFL